jgi:hypothetical protein
VKRLYALIGDFYHPSPYIEEGLRLALPAGSDSLAEIAVEIQPEEIPWNSLDAGDVLIGESAEHGSCPVGWAHSYGKGRVCCLTPGHTLEVLSHSMVRKLIRNAVNWCQGN